MNRKDDNAPTANNDVLSNATSSSGKTVQEKINLTAYGVAYLRSCEQEWFSDPFAGMLAGDAGKQWMEAVSARRQKECPEESPELIRSRFANAVTARTRKIDEEMLSIMTSWQEEEAGGGVGGQIVVLGAGLDTRPWRLSPPPTNHTVSFFEVDYQEIFDYKFKCLGEERIQSSKFDYHFVATDLSVSTWKEDLIRKGFNVNLPTIWLLEGLTGYLYEADCFQLFKSIYELSASNNGGNRSHVMMATFLTPAVESLRIPLHRFIPEDPVLFVKSTGWSHNIHLYDFEDLCTAFGRPSANPQRGYVLVTGSK